MLKVGLTGGIGSGKTTVSKVFADKNFKIFNSDDIAKNIIKTDSNSREILYNLVEQLEENDDIQKVFFNFEI